MRQLNRREFVALSSGALAAGLTSRLHAGGGQPAGPAPTFTPVRRGVNTFTARGGTIGWLSNRDALIVIDTQYPDTAKLCLDGLKTRAPRPVDLVFNTHHHIDHTGGNGVFKPVAKKIIAQARVPELQKMAAAQTPNADAPVLPDATFDQTWTEHAGDETITGRYYGPGHTGGDAVYHFERAGVVHMGDLLWLERHPRVDRPAGASIQNWMKTLETIARTMPRDAIYIAGHAKDGTPATARVDALTDFRDYFDAVLSTVRKGIAQGLSKDAIAATALPRFVVYQSNAPALTLAGVLGAAYDELTAQQ
ncbi:MAG TPA: MBL fold metallo-hydrolase [Vicinamibacterales bacterium]|nr:MBL fold metallo-hydrolase [Vicinamibacterales bacterium]